jgi:TorA maturation chaperone TorD
LIQDTPTRPLQDDSSVPSSAPHDEDRARAGIYALLGNLLAQSPDEALLGVLRGIPLREDGPGDLAGAWRELAVAAAEARPEALRDEYVALFIGLGRGEVVPYGSWYATGFLMERPLAELRAELRDLGFERQPGVQEPEDHAAALCDTMALLITGDPPASLDLQQGFYLRHIEPWMPRFFDDLQRAGSARFYRAVALLGRRFIDVETQAFRVTTPPADGRTPSEGAVP